MFILYLKPGCPFCAESVNLINKYKIKNKFYEINDPNKREQLKKKHKMETFPQIFYIKNKKQHKIGGNNELKQQIIFSKKIIKNIINNNIYTILDITKSLNPTNKKLLNFIKKM